MVQLVRVVEYTNCIPAEGSDFPNDCPVAQSAEAVEYTNCISAEDSDFPNECPVAQNTPIAYLQRSKTPPMSVLDITLNNLMVRLQ